MSNPNNCEACDHKKHNKDGGQCYMFKGEPKEVCFVHSARTNGRMTDDDLILGLMQLIGAKL